MNHVVEHIGNLEIEVLYDNPSLFHIKEIRFGCSNLLKSTFLIHLESESHCFYTGWLLELNITEKMIYAF